MEKNKSSFLITVSILIATLTDICFYDNFSGVSNTIYEIFIIGLLIYIKKDKLKHKLTRWDYIYAAILGLLSFVPTVSASGGMIFLEVVLYSMIVIKWAIHIAYEIDTIPINKYIMIYFHLMRKSFSEMFAPLRDLDEKKFFKQRNQFWNQQNDSDENTENNVLQEQKEDKADVKMQVVRGVVIAIPILFFVIILLASSDAMFREIVTSIIYIPDSIGDVFGIAMLFLLAYAIAYGVGRALILKKIDVSAKAVSRTNAVTGITFCGIFAVVYVLFVLVQIVGLFNKSGILLPDDYTYARYAREGFFQLLVVCIINAIMVVISRIRFEEKKILKQLLYVISGCTYCMIFSATYRMMLYIRVYDLTVLRLFALYGLISIFLIMIAVIVFIKNVNIKMSEYIVVIIGFGFAIFALARPEYIVAKYNVAHLDKEKTDYSYLRRLSNDAAGVILSSGVAEEFEYEYDDWDDKHVKVVNENDYTDNIITSYENDIKGDARKFNISDVIAYHAAQKYEKKQGR